MGIYDDVVEVTRRTMVLFFVVDTSGSMNGAKIGTVNSAIEEIVPELKEISEENADAQIKIASLSFSTGAKWINEPISAENFRWNYLSANGVTDLGKAFAELNDKLSRNAYMGDIAGSFAPVIFLMSDGEPTDNYMDNLEELRKNNWFKKAIKVAVAIGKDANKRVLAEFTGCDEAVISVHTPDALRKWIQFVSVTASQIGSRSANAGTINTKGGTSLTGGKINLTKQDEFIREIKAQEAADAAEWDSFDDDGIEW
ncbi:MAG: VWA domain-containing protein [Ruminococcus sp.]|nr:VWA domain-containing protein [Ruminococcus sp.]